MPRTYIEIEETDPDPDSDGGDIPVIAIRGRIDGQTIIDLLTPVLSRALADQVGKLGINPGALGSAIGSRLPFRRRHDAETPPGK